MVNCILCGVGGQGSVLASKLIAQAAMDEGFSVRTAETIGMAQRGGCVVSHLRFGETIHSPMVPKGEADILLAFEPGEAVRNLSYLREGGVMVVAKKAVMPVTASLSGADYKGEQMIAFLQNQPIRLILVDGDAVCAACGSAKVLNVALLGAACASGALGLSVPAIEAALKKRVKPQFLEMNARALRLGAEAAR